MNSILTPDLRRTNNARSETLSPSVESVPRDVFRRQARAWMITLPADVAALSVPTLWSVHYVRGLAVMTLLAVALLAAGGRYRARLHVSLLDELPSLVGRSFTAAAAVACVYALRHPAVDVSDFLRTALVGIAALIIGRTITNFCIVLARRQRLVAHQTIILGIGPVGVELGRLLAAHARYGLRVVAYVDDRDATDAMIVSVPGVPNVERIDDLERVIRRTRAEVLLVADPKRDDRKLTQMLSQPWAAGCDLVVVPRLNDFHTQAGLVDHIGAVPIMRIRRPSLVGAGWVVKRVIDIVVSGVALVLLSPVMVLCAFAVRLEGGRGVFFRQERVTAQGRTFQVLKFRSMKPTDENDSATTWSISKSGRVGPIGRLLRKTSLDELPQLINILRGDMTLVGPRPERPHFVKQFSAEHPHYGQRHRVRSGLTGLAQVSGLRGDTSISDRARHDNFYIENWSLWLDVKILLRTIREVIRGGGG